MIMQEFINKNKEMIDACILNVCGNVQLDDEERDDWILNDERLYNWALFEGVDV